MESGPTVAGDHSGDWSTLEGTEDCPGEANHIRPAKQTDPQPNQQDLDQGTNGIFQSERCLGGCNQWWLLAGVALLIGSIGVAATSFLKVNGTVQPLNYGVVIDEGSTHSKIFVYKWKADKYNNTAVAKQTFTQIAKGDPTKAGPSLTGILDAAKGVVPTTDQKKTPVFLGSTAGMRLLEVVNKNQSDTILSSVRNTISSYPFNFSLPTKQAVILPGKDEGAFGWITVNYLLENFGKTDMFTYFLMNPSPKTAVSGALDMGGASTQLTFYPEIPGDLPPESCSSLLLYGVTYNIYSHSYLCYGFDEMIRRYNAHLVKTQNYSKEVFDPCHPRGFNKTLSFSEIFEVPCTKEQRSLVPRFVLTNTIFIFLGASNVTKCKENVMSLFNFKATCDIEPCRFNGVHQPPLRGNFLAFSGFYTIVSFFNLKGSFPLEYFRGNYTVHCGKSWQEIKHTKYADAICIESTYIDILLTEGYGFDKNTWRNINFQRKIRNTEIGWSLGFMLNVSNNIPAEYPQSNISNAVFIILVLIFACFISIAFAFAVYAMSLRKATAKEYEQLKTYGSL